MKVLITGAGGNIGRAVIPRLVANGHEVVISDLNRLGDEEPFKGLEFHQIDVQQGFGLEKAAAGCDLLLHTPAWHGIHWGSKTEIDFWRLNVDGTFWAYQAARSTGISRVVFLSSQSWHGHYDKYGFTKRVGEELCEYHRQSNKISYVAVRPADLTPWGNDWVNHYGARLLYGGVDREDVADAIALSVEYLSKTRTEPEGLILSAVRPNAYTEEQLQGWQENPKAVLEKIFPNSADLIEKYGIKINHKPHVVNSFEGWKETGYTPTRHFGKFLENLRHLDETQGEEAVRNTYCPYS